MPFNGSGIFSLVSGNPVVTGTVISSTVQNNTMSDVAVALTDCVTKDGQSTPTANIPMGGFQITGLGNATTRGAAPNAGQIQDGGLVTLSAVAGADTITAATAPAITAYVSGQEFGFIAAGSNATAAVTINISGLGAKPITKAVNSALQPGDIVTGQIVKIKFDGTQFQVISPLNVTTGVVGGVRNGKFSLPAANSVGVFSADEVIVETALGGTAYKLANYSQTINLAALGINGMDVGSAPISSYVALYAIFNPTTGAVSILGHNAASAQPNVYGGANMPAGYTASALLAVLPTNGSGQMLACSVTDRHVLIAPLFALSTNVVQTAQLALSLPITPNAKSVSGYLLISSNIAYSGSLIVQANTGNLGQFSFQASAVANAPLTSKFDLDLPSPQTLVYNDSISSGTPSFQIVVNAYSF